MTKDFGQAVDDNQVTTAPYRNQQHIFRIGAFASSSTLSVPETITTKRSLSLTFSFMWRWRRGREGKGLPSFRYLTHVAHRQMNWFSLPSTARKIS